MKKINWERLRFYFLIALILTSFIQVGILWGYQDYGFPFNFFGQKTSLELGDESAVKSLLNPFRIIISEGSGDAEKDEPSRWVLSNSKDVDYITFWEDAKYYLKEGLTSGQKPAISDFKDWSSLAVSKKSVIYDFNTKMNQSLLLWLLDIDSIPVGLPVDISKIIISPWESSGILYISDGFKLYSYYLNFDEKKLKEYAGIFDRYSNTEDRSIRKYTFLGTLDSDDSTFSKDLLVIVRGGQYSGFRHVSFSVPEVFSATKTNNQNQVNEIASVLLGTDKDGYDRTIDSGSGTIEFKTQNKIYKLYSSGDLEYNFITDVQSSDKGELKDALITSYKLLSGIKSLLSEKSELYLSRVTENLKGSYTLYFDYIVEGIPIVITGSGQDQDISSAVEIEVNKKGILSCRAKIKDFTQEKSEELYGVYFENLQTEVYKRIKELNENNSLYIKKITISYCVSEDSKEVKPVWVLETNNKKYIFPMHSK